MSTLRHETRKTAICWLAATVAVVAAGTAEAAGPAAAAAFATFCRERAEEAVKANHAVVHGTDNWLFLTSELRHLGAGMFWGEAAQTVSMATREDARDPMPAIIDTARQLRDKGIALLLVPVPPRAVVYADKLWSEVPREALDGARPGLAVSLTEFYALLRAQGVEVLDLAETLQAARSTDTTEGPVYCRQDSHWSPRGAAVAAQQIAAWINAREIVEEGSLKTSQNSERAELSGDLWRLLGDDTLSRETLPLRHVTDLDGAAIPVDPSSPVLVLADSHGLVFSIGGDMHAEGAGLRDHLAAALARPVDLIARRGSAATAVRIDLARRIRSDPQFAATKKVVVWCFAARDLTESTGWRDVPLFP